MKDKTILTIAILAIIAIAAVVYIINTMETKPEGVSRETGLTETTIALIDGVGRNITVQLPVNRIVTLNSGITELLYALGAGDKVIGRDANSIFPSQVKAKPVVASSSYDPNVELLLELHPDLVLADDMLFYNQEALSKLEEAKIPVVIDNPTNITRIKPLITNLGRILQAKDKAEEIIAFIEQYEKTIRERVDQIGYRPLVYIEWWAPWQSFAKGSAGNEIIFNAGGLNIAAEIRDPAPVLSPEFVVEKNPDIIIRMAPSEARGNLTAINAVRNEILNRPELQVTKAVKTGKVYIYDPVLFEGLRYPVGLLYWAKCFHPELFADMNPEAIHSQLVKKYFGCELEGVYFYPPP
ncbi:MAG: ABC transporter substrate-binding protein [Candidatus Bathyarchaeota archaeon]|nr:ABC transporter substrate-binding protein [Candidatus Bathyarchaeota archaeon]MCX8177256.1 ABC transporter substrate-binding protein [Candidatus Bathyarchaeota archaeon]MDW8193500.1 ABC transporter substrate-binding protein [Nitrososphaerota archaeon]